MSAVSLTVSVSTVGNVDCPRGGRDHGIGPGAEGGGWLGLLRNHVSKPPHSRSGNRLFNASNLSKDTPSIFHSAAMPLARRHPQRKRQNSAGVASQNTWGAHPMAPAASMNAAQSRSSPCSTDFEIFIRRVRSRLSEEDRGRPVSLAGSVKHVLCFFAGHCKSGRQLLHKLGPSRSPICHKVNYRYANEIPSLCVIAPDHAGRLFS